MSTTTTTTTIPASTRAQLVRSTRKLAHILGTTPSPSDSDTDSITSFSSYRLPLRKKASMKPSAYFNLSSTSTSPEPEALSLPLFTPSPTATDFELNEHADKRRRFAKVCRTLGENIPPELVFGIPPAYESKSSKHAVSHRKRGKSVSHMISFSRSVESSRTSVSIARDKSEIGPFCPPPSPVMPHLDRSSTTLSSSSSSSTSDDDEASPCVRGGPGWVGKWNRQSMGEVRMRLRELK